MLKAHGCEDGPLWKVSRVHRISGMQKHEETYYGEGFIRAVPGLQGRDHCHEAHQDAKIFLWMFKVSGVQARVVAETWE